MNDRLGHNLNQTWKSSNGVVKATDSSSQVSAHIQLWKETHPFLHNWDHDFLPKLIKYAEPEKIASYQEGFNRALELVKNGHIDIENVEIDTSIKPSFGSTLVIFKSCNLSPCI